MKDHSRSPQLILYLIPIFGTLPAVWTLCRKNGTPQQRAVSRLSVMLALSWFLAYSLLGAGGSLTPSTIWSLRLLYLDGLITSGYFISCLVLLIRIWQGKSPKLPGISPLLSNH
ncbi:MAG: hypothetical protein BRC33_07610 [Cyanobacteria bacterium SW_9_44_58]|nr:MAG: hypothetical protein BRC33_07610 [Cyanobacteria bacterium SW_9_44_58]